MTFTQIILYRFIN